MPALSIIPAKAVGDTRLTDANLRVLCAIGIHSSKLGGQVWASIATLAEESGLEERSVQRAIKVLLELGYIRREERAGRTHLIDVLLDLPLEGRAVDKKPPKKAKGGVTPESPGGDSRVGGGCLQSHPNDKTNDETNDVSGGEGGGGVGLSTSTEPRPKTEQQLVYDWLLLLGEIYPLRPEPVNMVRLLKIVKAMPELKDRVVQEAALVGAKAYAHQVAVEGTEPKYVASIYRFVEEAGWRNWGLRVEPRVHGLTRQQWIRTGQDVAVWDAAFHQQLTEKRIPASV